MTLKPFGMKFYWTDESNVELFGRQGSCFYLNKNTIIIWNLHFMFAQVAFFMLDYVWTSETV